MELKDNPTLPPNVRKFFADMGAKGGRKSRRKLTRSQALGMVAAKKAKAKEQTS